MNSQNTLLALPIAVSLAACQSSDRHQPPSDLLTTTSALTIADVQPYALPVAWTPDAFIGTRGNYFADVTGDGRADLIAINDNTILVRPAPASGTGFGDTQTWLEGAFYGSKGTFFADVTGDGRADAVGVGDDYIGVLPSTGSTFGSYETWRVGAFYGSKGTFFADVTGDGRADAVGVGDDYIGVLPSTGSTFGSYETWLVGAFYGSKGTFFADVTGDGIADAVGVGDDYIGVLRSNGFTFGSYEHWASGTGWGQRGTFVTDVTGDGVADVVAIRDNGIFMRRSGRWFFGATEEAMAPAPQTLFSNAAMADLNADGRSDVIQRESNGMTKVRLRQDRRVPLRIVQIVANCGSNAVRTDAQIQAGIDNANASFGDTGVAFYAREVSNSVCPGFTKSHVVVSPTLSDVRDPVPPPPEPIGAPEAELLMVKNSFNDACDIGYDDLAKASKGTQLWWLAARCSLPGELLAFVTISGTSAGNDPSDGKLVMLDPWDGFSVASNRLAHELGHYFALPHSFDIGYAGQITMIDPATGQGAPVASYWDLVFSGSQFFRSKAAASAFESSLTSIAVSNPKGSYCFGTTPQTTCPFGATPPKTAVRIPLGGSTSNVAYTYLPNPFGALTFDERLKGIAPRIPGNMAGIDSMSYSYNPSDPPLLKRRFSLSQIEVIQNNLKGDALTKYLDASGRVIYGDRPRLGLGDGAPPTGLRFMVNPGTAAPGPGTIAVNGWNTWVIGTTPFDSNGNQIEEWDARRRVWMVRSGGARQIALPWSSNRPWAITGSIPGPVKRWSWDTASFQNLPGDPSAQACARSIAVGDHPTGPSVWSIGCEGPNSDGNFKIERYQELYQSTGWQKTAGSGEGWGVQMAVDSNGVPWVRTQFSGGTQATLYRGELTTAGVLSGWTQFPPPSGVKPVHLNGGARRDAHTSFALPVNFIGDNGHIYAFDTTTRSWTDNGSVPSGVSAVSGALPYLWLTTGSGQIWYAH